MVEISSCSVRTKLDVVQNGKQYGSTVVLVSRSRNRESKGSCESCRS